MSEEEEEEELATTSVDWPIKGEQTMAEECFSNSNRDISRRPSALKCKIKAFKAFKAVKAFTFTAFHKDPYKNYSLC